MSSPLKQRIQDDMKDAMRARDKERLAVIRLITAAIKQVEVDERIDDIDDARVSSILQKMVKQRKDSFQQYEAGGRQDLADVEAYEMDIIQAYMPEPLSDEELAQMIDEAISKTGAASIKEMGKVIGMLKGMTEGRADMGAVSGLVKARLAG